MSPPSVSHMQSEEGPNFIGAVTGIGEFAVARRYGDRIRPFFLFWGQLIGLQRGETDGILGAALLRRREECYKASSRQQVLHCLPPYAAPERLAEQMILRRALGVCSPKKST